MLLKAHKKCLASNCIKVILIKDKSHQCNQYSQIFILTELYSWQS